MWRTIERSRCQSLQLLDSFACLLTEKKARDKGNKFDRADMRIYHLRKFIYSNTFKLQRNPLIFYEAINSKFDCRFRSDRSHRFELELRLAAE